jgi:hypothetical protein
MSDQSKVSSAKLPHTTGSAKFSKKQTTFADMASGVNLTAENAASLPSGAARCYAYKKSSNIRCSKPAYPGSRFCSQDHLNWDKKADGAAYRVYTAGDTCEEGDPQATSEKPEEVPNHESSHSGNKSISTAQELLGPLEGFAAVVAETADLTKPQHGRVASLVDSEHATSDELWANILVPAFDNIRKFLTPETLAKWLPTPNSPGFKELADSITAVRFKADLFGHTESTFSVSMLLGPVNSMGKIAGVSQFCEILEVLRCTDDKFCDLSGADALALQQVDDTPAASGSADSTVAVRDPSSLQELISALTAKIPPLIVAWASKLINEAAIAGNVFTAPFAHMLPLLFLAPSQHANLPDLQTLYTRTHFARVDLCTSMAPMLSGHWPSLDLLASALTPVLRDMEASIEVELKK